MLDFLKRRKKTSYDVAGILTERKNCELKTLNELETFDYKIDKKIFETRTQNIARKLKKMFDSFKRVKKNFEYNGETVDYEVFKPQKKLQSQMLCYLVD